MASSISSAAVAPRGADRSGLAARLGLAAALAVALALALVFILGPVLSLLLRGVQDGSGAYVGGLSFARYLATPALGESLLRSLRVAALSAAITTVIAFVYAYALTQSCMRFKPLFRAVALVPLLAPSLLMAISLIYLFGHQGLLKSWFGPGAIYGEAGIVLGSVLWTLPHALLILGTSLATIDGRLFEAAQTLGASGWRQFTSVTLPAARYGVAMAFAVVFVLVITDFGVPKVVGGQANVLATDIYKQVVGQQNFQMGAVVGCLLLIPALLATGVEMLLRRRQTAALSARAVPYTPTPHSLRDGLLLGFCSVVSLSLLAVIGVAIFASLASYWPYDLSPSLRNYRFDMMDGGGWTSYGNSLQLALWTALVGSLLAFGSAWLVDKPRPLAPVREALNLAATLPLAVPGLVLGVGYIFAFNSATHPLHPIYGTLTILVACTVAHFFAVAHLTMLSALRQLDREFESVAESLGVPAWRTLLAVHLPVTLPALLAVAGYFFVNAMTTVSAVVFLYSPDTTLASVAVLNMDDAGDVAPAAAMAVLIFVTAAVGRGLIALGSRALLVRTQAWRAR
jgi:iron(III) transport system permease protein